MSEDKKNVSPDDLGETKSFTLDSIQTKENTSAVKTEETVAIAENNEEKTAITPLVDLSSSETPESEGSESVPVKKSLKKPIKITLVAILAAALLGIGGYFAWTSGLINIDSTGVELYWGAKLAAAPEALVETFVKGVFSRDPSEIVKAYPPELQDKYHRDRTSRAKLHKTLSSGIGASVPEEMDLEIISKSPMTEEQLQAARKYAASNATPISMPSMSGLTEGYILTCCVTVDTVTRQETVPVVHTQKGWCIAPDFAFGIK